MDYGWIIDRDVLAEEEARDGDPVGMGDEEGTQGPRRISAEISQRLLNGEGVKFRMYDADGILYYEGRLIGDVESEDGFAPLDDFGAPNAGATRIDYLSDETDVWETL